jgi:hypothetical protein
VNNLALIRIDLATGRDHVNENVFVFGFAPFVDIVNWSVVQWRRDAAHNGNVQRLPLVDVIRYHLDRANAIELAVLTPKCLSKPYPFVLFLIVLLLLHCFYSAFFGCSESMRVLSLFIQ